MNPFWMLCTTFAESDSCNYGRLSNSTDARAKLLTVETTSSNWRPASVFVSLYLSIWQTPWLVAKHHKKVNIFTRQDTFEKASGVGGVGCHHDYGHDHDHDYNHDHVHDHDHDVATLVCKVTSQCGNMRPYQRNLLSLSCFDLGMYTRLSPQHLAKNQLQP